MNFFKKLISKGCLHRFSWPRMYTDGNHYQTCSLCGISYEYDWMEMRRTNRVKAVQGDLQMIVAHDSKHQSPPTKRLNPSQS